VKDRISRPEEGEWEAIKILHENLSYIPNLTQHISLLTWPRQHSYKQAIYHQNRVIKQISQQKHKSGKQSYERNYDNRNKTDKVSYHLTHISLNTYDAWRTRTEKNSNPQIRRRIAMATHTEKRANRDKIGASRDGRERTKIAALTTSAREQEKPNTNRLVKLCAWWQKMKRRDRHLTTEAKNLAKRKLG
jgi:hypothetical protein